MCDVKYEDLPVISTGPFGEIDNLAWSYILLGRYNVLSWTVVNNILGGGWHVAKYGNVT